MMDESFDSPSEAPETQAAETVSRFKWIGWSSLFLAIVQSVCTIFAALSGLRLVLGAAAFGAAIGVMKFADEKIHIDAVRIPMSVFALSGAVFNLAALWQVRRLRGRAASAWRQKTVPRSKFASEGVQLTLSVLTLILLAVESFYHLRNTHHL
jgi:cytochrome bd-type quinol oxidase subunit 2